MIHSPLKKEGEREKAIAAQLRLIVVPSYPIRTSSALTIITLLLDVVVDIVVVVVVVVL